jgi:O-acetyl-ADP-ribose deacetylase (regulator of RNase III)
MKIRLTDQNAELVAEWAKVAADFVECICGDIFTSPADAVVSPANSFGFMDGGIDLAYSLRFGWHVQEQVQAKIVADFAGELLVGQALTVATNDPQFPWLIAAPTMRVPMVIADPNAVRLATRAAVRAAAFLGVATLLMPGMGTATGRVAPALASRLMMAGIRDALSPAPFPQSWLAASDDHYSHFRN